VAALGSAPSGPRPRLEDGLGLRLELILKPMKLNWFTAALILLITCATQSSAQSSSIFGAYQDCPFYCRTIKINPDFTFEHVSDGDLFNDERIKGTWKFIGRNKIKATSPEDRSTPQVTEKVTNRENGFRVRILDQARGNVKGAAVSGIANGSAFRFIINDEGIALIPKTEQFEITFDGYRGIHKVAHSQADDFLVTLTFKQMTTWVLDQVWLIEGNRFYIAGEDCTFDKRTWLAKLSRKRERRIFR
jgi:hypothetical protein